MGLRLAVPQSGRLPEGEATGGLANQAAGVALALGRCRSWDCYLGQPPQTVPAAARACIVQVARNSGGGAKVVMQNG